MKLIYLLIILEFLNFAIFITSFPAYVRSIGGSNIFLGSLTSISAFISLLWNPIAGSLGDTEGRKNILRKCLTISLVGNMVMLLPAALPIVLLSRLLCAFGSPVQVLIKTIATDIAKDKEEKNKALSIIAALFGVCFMVGALIGGFLSELENGKSVIYSIISLNVFISLASSSLLPNPVIPKSKANKNGSILESFKGELKTIYANIKNINWNKYGDLFAIKGCMDLSLGIMQGNLGMIFAEVFKIKGRNIGYVISMLSICSIATNIMMPKIRKTFYADDAGFKRIIHAIIMLIITYLGMGLSSKFSTFVIFIGTMSVSRTLLDQTSTEVLTDRTEDKDKGKLLSLFDSLMQLSQIVSPLLSGLIADTLGIRIPVLLCTIPATIACLLAIKQGQTSKKIK